MMRKPQVVRSFEDAYSSARSTDYLENVAIFEAMWVEAVALGILPGIDPLAGIEVDLRLARMINSVP